MPLWVKSILENKQFQLTDRVTAFGDYIIIQGHHRDWFDLLFAF